MAQESAVKMENTAHYMCHTVITQTVKTRPFPFFLFLLFLSSNVCQVSLQSFNSCQKISSAIHHQLTFKFIFLQAAFFFLCAEFTERQKMCEKNKEITWMEEICLMSYEMDKFF